jgi:[ribulose-bisphosphate carboxylase]-lysine N-methyltransferase
MEYYAERRLKRLGLLDEKGKSTWDGFFEDGIA